MPQELRIGVRITTDNATTLVVLLHSYTSNAKNLDRAAPAVRDAVPQSDVFVPELPLSVFSFADPGEIVRDVLRFIDERLNAHSYSRIVLVGHSTGAILARRIWVEAHGVSADLTIDDERKRPWADLVDRIVLLAATNRGWSISSAVSYPSRLLWSIGTGWGNICRFLFRRQLLIFGFRRGAPFLTTTRLQSLTLERHLVHLGKKPQVVVQLVGTDDDLVAPADNIDLATGSSFHYIEVRGATHMNLVKLSGEAGTKFHVAMGGTEAEVKSEAMQPDDVRDLFEYAADDFDRVTRPNSASVPVKHVVFVIHGIRDYGFWTRRIALAVKKLAKNQGIPCRSVTSTYGYFPMGPFLLGHVRRSKVEWFLDQYVTAKSLYPEAEMSYIGHSNGTYLLAKGLDLCEAISFERVIFAGSVVLRRFSWKPFIDAGRIKAIVNYVATRDLVVAIFPQGLERLAIPDLGGAGHNGFIDPSVIEVHATGGHGAALEDQHWPNMASFVINGDPPPDDQHAIADESAAWLGRNAGVIWFVMIAIVLGLAGLLVWWITVSGSWLVLIAVAIFISILSVVLLKV